MTLDSELRDLQRQAAGHLRAAMDQLDAARRELSLSGYRIWVSADKTLLVRLWDGGRMEVCTRPAGDAIWSPPTQLFEENT